jgi:hypothetical protein
VWQHRNIKNKITLALQEKKRGKKIEWQKATPINDYSKAVREKNIKQSKYKPNTATKNKTEPNQHQEPHSQKNEQKTTTKTNQTKPQKTSTTATKNHTKNKTPTALKGLSVGGFKGKMERNGKSCK